VKILDRIDSWLRSHIVDVVFYGVLMSVVLLWLAVKPWQRIEGVAGIILCLVLEGLRRAGYWRLMPDRKEGRTDTEA
jgi:hypothetical protein